MFRKVLQVAIFILVAVIVLMLLAYGISQSDFSKIKKYDEIDTNSNTPVSALKAKLIKELYYTKKVKIINNSTANLGDFTVNLSDKDQLIMNISIKFKGLKSDSWLGGDSIKQEILDKGDVLRSSVIYTISNNRYATVRNDALKRKLVQNMNKYISKGEIEELYFNRFIIQ